MLRVLCEVRDLKYNGYLMIEGLGVDRTNPDVIGLGAARVI